MTKYTSLWVCPTSVNIANMLCHMFMVKRGVFKAAASRDRSLWIVKPAASSRGRGIFLIVTVRNALSLIHI